VVRKKNVIELKWSTKNEVDIEGYVVKRSTNGGEAVEIASYLTDPTLLAVGDVVSRYNHSDANAMANNTYFYIIEAIDIQQEYLRPRNYQALLFGEVLGANPDPFAFWHSTQKKDPGLNVAFYENKKVDKLLEDARQTVEEEERTEKYAEFQKLLIEDVPVCISIQPYLSLSY